MAVYPPLTGAAGRSIGRCARAQRLSVLFVHCQSMEPDMAHSASNAVATPSGRRTTEPIAHTQGELPLQTVSTLAATNQPADLMSTAAASQPDDVLADLDFASQTPAERDDRFIREVGPLQSAVLRFARSFTSGFADPVAEAQDIAQTALQKAYASFHTYRPGTNLAGWLHRIVRNTAINEVRRRGRRPLETLGLDAFEDGDLARLHRNPQNLTASAEIEALDRFGDPDIAHAMQQLSEDRRTVVYLACVEQMSYQEIADIMGTPIGTVMSRLSRGRQQLRGLLSEVALERGVISAESCAQQQSQGDES